MPTVKPGESQSDYMSRCVPYVMAEAGTKSKSHAVAKCLGMYRQATQNARRQRPSPLRLDPSRTTSLRRAFMTEISKRLTLVKRALRKLVAEEDVFGLALTTLRNSSVRNTRWAFHTTPQQVQLFEAWIKKLLAAKLLNGHTLLEELGEGKSLPEMLLSDLYWEKYAALGYAQGAGRVFDETKAKAYAGVKWTKEQQAFYRGTKQQFLQSAFGQPVAKEKLQLLAGRVFTELKGITDRMAQVITRELVEGMARGEGPHAMARRMVKQGIGTKKRGIQSRALTIARTEIIRAHAEGQLDAFEQMGVEEIGVAVEWSTSGFEVCPACRAMEGVVLTTKEARGLIPRHPNCRCAFTPANVGESTKGQIRSKAKIQEAIERSIARVGAKKDSLAQKKKKTTWVGADRVVKKNRPKGIV